MFSVFIILCTQIQFAMTLLDIFLSTHWIDDESQLKEDEQLARALQESLNVESPPRHGNRNRNGNGNRNRNGNGNGNGNESGTGTGTGVGVGIGNGNGNGLGSGNIYHPVPFPYSMGFRYMGLLADDNFNLTFGVHFFKQAWFVLFSVTH